jgi:energy-coupling factor transporter transmembrane protein EcfT
MPTKRKPNDRVGIIQAISTPLGFYILALLIIESTLAIVLTCSKLTEEHVWIGFKVMLGLFMVVLVVVTILVFCFPTNLLFGKDEHANPVLESSALKDQIGDIISAKVNAEGLKKQNQEIN